MANTDVQETVIREKYQALRPFLNERTRRVWAATEARPLGHGGVAIVCSASFLLIAVP